MFKVNVPISRSFRVGRMNGDRARLLIVTLDTPGAKRDSLYIVYMALEFQTFATFS